MQRLKLAPVQMLDWGLYKAEDLTKRAVRKIPGHDRVEVLVDRVRRRRPQHPQRAVEHRRSDSRRSGRGSRADPDPGRGYGEWDRDRDFRSSAQGSVQMVRSTQDQNEFDEFAAFDEPASQSIFIDNICGEENGSINWTLDDPDEAFLLDTNYQENTLTITVDTDIAEPGDWEAQISIDEPFSDKQHHIQLFATTLSDEEPSD